VIEPTALYRQIIEMAGDIKPSVIVIASSANVFAGSEIDRTQVQQFVAMLSRIATAGRSGLVLISQPWPPMARCKPSDFWHHPSAGLLVIQTAISHW
jgi:RecA-family ATPase